MRLICSLLSSVLLVSLAAAAETQAVVCPNVLLRGCCDGYCPKPEPCVRPYCRCCGCDDYCRKPCPCVTGFHGCSFTDCYCRKPCPDVCRSIGADWYTCSLGGDGCVGPRAATMGTAAPAPIFRTDDVRIPNTCVLPDSPPDSPTR